MEIILSLIICFLAVYGLFKIIYGLAFALYKTDKTTAKYKNIVVGVDDNSQNIEGYIRAMSLKEEGTEIIIVDYSDKKDTKKFLKLIAGEFSFVTVTNPDEYAEYIKSV